MMLTIRSFLLSRYVKYEILLLKCDSLVLFSHSKQRYRNSTDRRASKSKWPLSLIGLTKAYYCKGKEWSGHASMRNRRPHNNQ